MFGEGLKQQILDSSKEKEFIEDNFKFDINSRQFSTRVENKVGKGEIAHNVYKLWFSHVCSMSAAIYPFPTMFTSSGFHTSAVQVF